MWDDLVCPADHGELERRSAQLTCRRCGRGYPVLESIPTLLPDDESPRWRRHQRRWLAQQPREPREEIFSIAPQVRDRGRRLERLLGEHLRLDSRCRILQIGPGAEGEIHHFRAGLRYAVDPLAGVLAERRLLRWGQIRWAAARGEQLPFREGSFAAVILGNVLDWVESPRRVLDEAWRCLATDGLLYIALGPRQPGSIRRVSLRRLQECHRGWRVVERGQMCDETWPARQDQGCIAGRVVAGAAQYLLLARSSSTLRVLRAA